MSIIVIKMWYALVFTELCGRYQQLLLHRWIFWDTASIMLYIQMTMIFFNINSKQKVGSLAGITIVHFLL